MAVQLFRQEVLEHQGERLWGSSIPLRTPALMTLTLLLVSIFITVMGLLIKGDYSRKETVVGAIVSSKGEVKVKAPVGGTIEVLAAELGRRVGKGATLLSIQAVNNFSHGIDISGQLLSENELQKEILKQLIRDKREAYPEKWRQLDAEQISLARSIAEQEKAITNEEQIVMLQHEKLARLSELSKQKHVSRSDVDLVKMESLGQENTLKKTRLSLLSSKRQLEKIKHEKTLILLEYQQQMAELAKSLSELRKQNLQLYSERERQVMSPITGTISVVYSHAGQEVMSQQPLVAIMPEDTSFEAQLLVPSRSIGFIEAGQKIILRIEAFPYQKFGMLNAQINEVSASVLLPEESETAVDIHEPYFRVNAVLAEQSIEAFGKQFILRPGMQIKADIVLDKRSLMEWILEPLFISGNSK